MCVFICAPPLFKTKFFEFHHFVKKILIVFFQIVIHLCNRFYSIVIETFEKLHFDTRKIRSDEKQHFDNNRIIK